MEEGLVVEHQSFIAPGIFGHGDFPHGEIRFHLVEGLAALGQLYFQLV